ncbi:MAG: hypothetical protein GTN86_03025 [Xanthomonadales bacterium]|nr:hypothetical protein [Xanthomonadales bacterium]NIN60258.1 hypothetical protein [Xanthomonadales bacterium]NIN74981.1 hypothetical protein [Xanthomonadales bacterium]NIO13600.1 hypothetical protein [Xanthomonadales bacterium]NIP12651.1 hypothetical protein [Xanthomonadales bacterium]
MHFRWIIASILVGAMGGLNSTSVAAEPESAAPLAVAQEAEQAREAVREVKRATLKAGTAAIPASASRLTAPDTEPLKYICMSGNCACAGVQDCVDMKDICAPGTMGCSEHGCTCAEGDSGDDGGDGG